MRIFKKIASLFHRDKGADRVYRDALKELNKYKRPYNNGVLMGRMKTKYEQENE